jgi:hypothetical protein
MFNLLGTACGPTLVEFAEPSSKAFTAIITVITFITDYETTGRFSINSLTSL